MISEEAVSKFNMELLGRFSDAAEKALALEIQNFQLKKLLTACREGMDPTSELAQRIETSIATKADVNHVPTADEISRMHSAILRAGHPVLVRATPAPGCTLDEAMSCPNYLTVFP